MKPPNLNKIDKMFEKGKNFTLSREKYISLTGADTPQDIYYLRTRSAIARHAKEHGYEIEVIPEKLVFRKV